MIRFGFFPVFFASVALAAPGDLTLEDASTRLRRALHVARETNKKSLVESVEETANKVLESLKRDDFKAAELLIQSIEIDVGLDAGGKTMQGQPIAQIPRATQRELDKAGPILADAMKAKDEPKIASIIEDMTKLLGDQAGIPDVRNKGETPKGTRQLKPPEVAELFLDLMALDRRTMAAITKGDKIPNQMARYYAHIVRGCCLIRPLVKEHRPNDLKSVDSLVEGACQILLELQSKDGYFIFPDLRGKHIRFGEMIEKLVKDNPDAVKNGWVEMVDPSGGSQFDAGEAGMALLLAGKVYEKKTWTEAGLRAADWAAKQDCVPNFNYNAFSISLLCHAFEATGDKKYLDSAIDKFRVGLSPGQYPSGRWIDAHNARTTYHLLILRGLHDLLEHGKHLDAASKKQIDEVASRATKTWLEEMGKVGVTNINFSLPELVRYTRVHPDEVRAKKLLEQTRILMIEKCFDEGQVRAGAALDAIPWLVAQ